MPKALFIILLLTFINFSLERDFTIYYNSDPDAYKGRAMDDGETCNINNCPAPHSCGSSGDIQACVCDEHYANYPFTGVDGVYCTHKRKKQIVAFLWELFTNLGIGHYYIHKVLRGFFKTLVMLTPLTIFALGKLRLLKYHYHDGTTGIVMFCIMCAFALAAFAWWLADAILFGTNKYRDSNEVPLQHW
ncbi:MAG: hypothetical protein MJ252_22325 [archaeon]|nr:hypothetical protein [archaeon]